MDHLNTQTYISTYVDTSICTSIVTVYATVYTLWPSLYLIQRTRSQF